MKSTSTIALCTVLFIAPALADDLEEQVAASRTAAKTFGTNLKTELQRAMKAGGPIAGIAVCNEKAPMIADTTSEELGLKVGRTSLKVRNPANAPDDWERVVLEQFEARKSAGESPEKLEFYEVVETDGAKTFRYMKAIPTAEICVACHGESISQELSAKIDELYPHDAARGFKVGDLRGAFTISEPL